MTILRPQQFPGEMRPAFESIHRRLTSRDPVGNEGAVAASLMAMTEDEASKVARDILDLYIRYAGYYRYGE